MVFWPAAVDWLVARQSKENHRPLSLVEWAVLERLRVQRRYSKRRRLLGKDSNCRRACLLAGPPIELAQTEPHMRRFCCDGLCNQGRDCPHEFKDTEPMDVPNSSIQMLRWSFRICVVAAILMWLGTYL